MGARRKKELRHDTHGDGSRYWFRFRDSGGFHRLDGPAVELADGSKSWWINGKRHRADGPAIERADGRKEWWVNGRKRRENIT